MERSGFIVDSKVAVDKFWMKVKNLSDFVHLFLFDVPEEVLVFGKAVSDAFDRSHFLNFKKNSIRNNLLTAKVYLNSNNII